MDYGTLASKVGSYQQLNTQSQVDSANPHRIIQLLLEGAIEKVALANGYIERKDIANAGSHISWAISIIDGLRASLDKSVESSVTTNLEDLYNYMERRLIEANIAKDPDILSEVSNLLKTIKSAWDQIPDDVKDAHSRREEFLNRGR